MKYQNPGAKMGCTFGRGNPPLECPLGTLPDCLGWYHPGILAPYWAVLCVDSRLVWHPSLFPLIKSSIALQHANVNMFCLAWLLQSPCTKWGHWKPSQFPASLATGRDFFKTWNPNICSLAVVFGGSKMLFIFSTPHYLLSSYFPHTSAYFHPQKWCCLLPRL